MTRNPRLYIADILECVRRIEVYTQGITENEFLGDEELQDAIIRRLEVIGEAVKRLELSFRDQHPAVPWKSMAGMRDMLIHEYSEINLARVWQTVKVDLPSLKLEISKIKAET